MYGALFISAVFVYEQIERNWLSPIIVDNWTILVLEKQETIVPTHLFPPESLAHIVRSTRCTLCTLSVTLIQLKCIWKLHRALQVWCNAYYCFDSNQFDLDNIYWALHLIAKSCSQSLKLWRVEICCFWSSFFLSPSPPLPPSFASFIQLQRFTSLYVFVFMHFTWNLHEMAYNLPMSGNTSATTVVRAPEKVKCSRQLHYQW